MAVKAANETNSEDDIGYIQDEIDQLVTEIDRVSETTKFNETYLLKGDVNAAKDKDFAYKEAEVIKQDLYYVEDNQIKTLKKGTLAAVVDTDKTYFSDSTKPKAGATIAVASSDDYVESAAVVWLTKSILRMMMETSM